MNIRYFFVQRLFFQKTNRREAHASALFQQVSAESRQLYLIAQALQKQCLIFAISKVCRAQALTEWHFLSVRRSALDAPKEEIK
jgi:hypothetical protein